MFLFPLVVTYLPVLIEVTCLIELTKKFPFSVFLALVRVFKSVHFEVSLFISKHENMYSSFCLHF